MSLIREIDKPIFEWPSIPSRPAIRIPLQDSKKSNKNPRKQKKGLWLLLLLISGLTGILWLIPEPNFILPKQELRPIKVALTNPIVRPVEIPGVLEKSKFFDELSDELKTHIVKTHGYVRRHINRATSLAPSLPGDVRLHHWSVVYDNAMRTIMHISLGEIQDAKNTIDYFIKNKAIQKTGWIRKNGQLLAREGWIINIVDAGEVRPGGRGIEHIAHTGPNAYLGIAAVHLYEVTGEGKYLSFARDRWRLIKELQNENPKDFNYGGVRMGPLGDPRYPQEQRLNFSDKNPSFYEFYNGEHAADFLAFSNLLSEVDPMYKKDYLRAAKLIQIWDNKIYDKKNHLFYIGTTEKRFYEENIGKWMNPGVMPIHPLDTSALKISAYGVNGLEQFEPQAAEKIRSAIERQFKVLVNIKKENRTEKVMGYDFIGHTERKELILFEEEGEFNDKKIIKGKGRNALLTDEWSTWVAFADLRLAADFMKNGNSEKSKKYMNLYVKNALQESIKTGMPLGPNETAYPYAHPLPYSLNKPVGFGWNTHHKPYSIIGGVARILGILKYDPFFLQGGRYRLNPVLPSLPASKLPVLTNRRPPGVLYTEAEMYIQEAWSLVRKAEYHEPDEEIQWQKAIDLIDRMKKEHKDWESIARKQNLLAKNSEDKYPLKGFSNLRIQDLESVYRLYWALYHIGTGEFIQMMAYSNLSKMAEENGDAIHQKLYQEKSIEAAKKIYTDYAFSQAYDEAGWFWQPVESMKEFVNIGDLAT